MGLLKKNTTQLRELKTPIFQYLDSLEVFHYFTKTIQSKGWGVRLLSLLSVKILKSALKKELKELPPLSFRNETTEFRQYVQWVQLQQVNLVFRCEPYSIKYGNIP